MEKLLCLQPTAAPLPAVGSYRNLQLSWAGKCSRLQVGKWRGFRTGIRCVALIPPDPPGSGLETRGRLQPLGASERGAGPPCRRKSERRGRSDGGNRTVPSPRAGHLGGRRDTELRLWAVLGSWFAAGEALRCSNPLLLGQPGTTPLPQQAALPQAALPAPAGRSWKRVGARGRRPWRRGN